VDGDDRRRPRRLLRRWRRARPLGSDVPLGYEVTVFQSGGLIAHLRLAGHCSSTVCDMQTVKVRIT
jgi:hypothetical protein